MSRPERTCTSCGARTTSQVRLCQACKPWTEIELSPADILDDGVTGEWVRRGLVWDWIPWGVGAA